MLIVNPAAGKGSYKINFGEALNILDRGGYRTTVFFTSAPTEATDFAAKYARRRTANARRKYACV